MMRGVFGGMRLLLAPMAGVSDPVFRRICCEMGADLAFSEMVSAKGLSYENEKTRQLVELGEGEERISVQIFGHEGDSMARQAAWVEESLGDALVSIDINMGCPVRKIVSKGDGSALMKQPKLAASIMSAVASAVSVPATCKFRRSWDPSGYYVSCVEFAKRMEEAGAHAITVHGRYSTQMYRGASDRECIALTKEAVSIPVIGNGDVFSAADAIEMAQVTGCDAIMVARGAQGNPWIFSEIAHALGLADGLADSLLDLGDAGDGGLRAAPTVEPYVAPSAEERIETLRRHATLLAQRTGGHLSAMRKHAMWYVHGMPGASRAREAFSACSTIEDFDCVLDELKEAAYAARSV